MSRFYCGGAVDRPLAADFNGDWIDDPALFDGEWIVPGVTRAHFGLPGDLPATR